MQASVRTADRTPIIAGNWKMHKTQAEASGFLTGFLPQITHATVAQVVLCVPFTALATVGQQLQTCAGRVALGAQNIHWDDCGAFTGEIAGSMLVELGVSYVIVGHSERREYFGETDETVNWRLRAAQKHSITPILCVGETKQIRDQGQTDQWIQHQLTQNLKGVDLADLVIAYEPIWAIGTGETCDATESNRVIGMIRDHIRDARVPIQYGGSVKPNNVDELMAQPEIDGALVGGASLDPESFARIANCQVLRQISVR